jgi:hypothetical protein
MYPSAMELRERPRSKRTSELRYPPDIVESCSERRAYVLARLELDRGL